MQGPGDGAVRFNSVEIAEGYLERRFRGRELRVPDDRSPNLDDGFCLRVANWFDGLASAPEDAGVRRLYLRMREEARSQYEAMLDAGVRVLPWTSPGQPYASARQMWDELDGDGVLRIYLTEAGHGPDERRDPANPLLEPCGVEVGGRPLLYNDLLRAVHDFFGHYLRRDHFTLRGELRAAFHHFGMFSAELHPVVFTEFVAQICWFYCGPHLADGNGLIPRRGTPGWSPPRRRPFPPQKVCRMPASFVEDFLSRFVTAESIEAGGVRAS